MCMPGNVDEAIVAVVVVVVIHHYLARSLCLPHGITEYYFAFTLCKFDFFTNNFVYNEFTFVHKSIPYLRKKPTFWLHLYYSLLLLPD